MGLNEAQLCAALGRADRRSVCPHVKTNGALVDRALRDDLAW